MSELIPPPGHARIVPEKLGGRAVKVPVQSVQSLASGSTDNLSTTETLPTGGVLRKDSVSSTSSTGKSSAWQKMKGAFNHTKEKNEQIWGRYDEDEDGWNKQSLSKREQREGKDRQTASSAARREAWNSWTTLR